MCRFWLPVILLFVAFTALGESSTQGKAGYPNMQPLVDRVEQAISAQQAAVERFQADQQVLLALANYKGGELQPRYADLFHAYTSSVEGVVGVSMAVSEVDQAASEIFRFWGEEVEVYTDASLKAESQAGLAKTRLSYDTLIQSLRQSEAKLDPALAALKTNVTHFKHQLKPSALAELKPALLALEREIADVTDLLNNSIESSKAFLGDVSRQGAR